MAHRIRNMLRRADHASRRSSLDASDLRGWHFVITGGVLLARSPYGPEDGMNGRWAFVQDSYANVQEGLNRLRAVVATCERRVERVIPLPDRGSRAVAQAAAQLLDVPLVRPDDPRSGLVVGYDLTDVDEEPLRQLAWHEPERPLYVHAARWTQTGPVAPDFLTMLYQEIVAPWGQGMGMTIYDSGARNVQTLPADDSPPEVLARHILAADPAASSLDSPDGAPELQLFAAAVRAVAAGTADSGGREQFWPGGPVASARFT